MSVVPKISTAPNVQPFATADLTDQTTVSFGSPIVNDLIQKNHRGVRSTVKRSIQRVLIFDVLGLTVANKLQLDEWKGNRVRLRPFANYDASTILYHSFQRASVIDGKIGFQIGEEPTHSAAELSGQQGQWSYIKDNGDIQVVADGTPKYQRGPWEAHGFQPYATETANYVPTHPITGNHVFATIHSGTPTHAEVDYGDSPVVRSNGVRMEKTAHLVGATALDEIRTVTLTSVSGTIHSWFVYIKGAGQITVRVVKNSSVELGTHQQTLDGTWQRFDVEDITKLAGDSYTFHIRFDTPGQCFVGPFGLTSNNEGKNAGYIHAETGTATQMDVSEIQFPNLRFPDAQYTMSCGVRTPLSTIIGNRWPIHKDQTTALYRIGLAWSGVQPRWNFHHMDNTQIATFNSVLGYGVDVVIAGCQDPTDMRLFENGIKMDTNVTPFVGAVELKGIHIADGESNGAGMQVGWVRVDRIKHTDAEILAQAALYTDPEARVFTLACEGRSFEIGNMNLIPLEGNPDQYDGVVQLIEVDSVEQSTTELQ